MIVSNGAAAPDAKVFKAPRQPVQLRELYGSPTVLLFFPMAFSSTCTEEMCTMSDDIARYESLGARVLCDEAYRWLVVAGASPAKA